MKRESPKTTALVVALCLAIIATLPGCGCRSRPATPEGRLTPPESAPTTPDGATAPDDGPQRVTFDSGGIEIVASHWPPSGAEQPAVLLVHQLGSDRHEWAPLVDLLRRERPQWGLLAIDMRGHGDSTSRAGTTTPVSFRDFSTEEWQGIQQDVAKALEFLRGDQGGQPSAIGLVGSSIGSSACALELARGLTPGADTPPAPPVRALVMLSPGLAYHQLDTAAPIERISAAGIPVLAFAAAGDSTSAAALRGLSERSRGFVGVSLSGDAHGVRMAPANAALFPRVVAFLGEQLTGTTPTAPAGDE